MKDNSIRKTITVIMIIATLMIALFSACCIERNINHKCTGENCVICMSLNICKETSDSLGKVIEIAVIAAVADKLNIAITDFLKRPTNCLINMCF